MHPSHETQVHNKQSPRYAHENPNHTINLPMQTGSKKMKFLEKLWVCWLGGSLAHAGISYDKAEFYVILVPTVVLVFLKDYINEK